MDSGTALNELSRMVETVVGAQLVNTDLFVNVEQNAQAPGGHYMEVGLTLPMRTDFGPTLLRRMLVLFDPNRAHYAYQLFGLQMETGELLESEITVERDQREMAAIVAGYVDASATFLSQQN